MSACGLPLRLQKQDCVLFFAGSAHRWQTLPDAPAIGFVDQTRVADHQDTVDELVTNQSSRTLFEGDDRVWQLVIHERIAAIGPNVVDTRGQYGVVWW